MDLLSGNRLSFHHSAILSVECLSSTGMPPTVYAKGGVQVVDIVNQGRLSLGECYRIFQALDTNLAFVVKVGWSPYKIETQEKECYCESGQHPANRGLPLFQELIRPFP